VRTFQIRTLGSLPWPHGLGKAEYKTLEHRMQRHMGMDTYYSRDAHRVSFDTDPIYRGIALDELCQTHWAQGLVELSARVVTAARTAPLLDKPLTDSEPWCEWARNYDTREAYLRSWLINPIRVDANEIGDGRHRLTYLRLVTDPSFEILVEHIH